MKSWIKLSIFFAVLTFALFDSLRFLEQMLAKDPASTFFYVLLEFVIVGTPLVAGSTLFMEEAFKRPPKPKEVDLETFIGQLENGKLKLSHEGLVKLAKALDGRLKFAGETLSVHIVKPEEKQTGIVIERSIS